MKPFTYILTLVIGIGIGWTVARNRPAQNPAGISAVVAESKVAIMPQKPVENLAPSTAAIQTQPKNNENLKAQLTSLTDEFWKEFNNNELEKARAIVDKMGLVSKDGKEYNEGLTRILVRSRDYDEAKPALQHCLLLYPKSKSCLTDLVDVELNIGTRAEQLQAAQNCLATLPGYPQCLNDLAIIRMHEGNFPDAVSIYEKLMETNGSFGFRFNLEMLHSQLGYALEGAGRIREAAQEFNIACRSNWSGACSKYEELSQRL